MGRTSVVTDDFNRADNADLGAAWDPYTTFGSLKIVSNAVRSAAAAGDNRAEGNTTALNNDQYVKAKIAAFTSADHVAVIVRGSVGSSNNFYMLLARPGAGTTNLYRVDAGVLTSLASVANPGWAVNDTIELEIIGTTLTAFRNGVTFGLTATDSTFSSGRAGLWINHGGTEANMILDDFEAGNVTADAAGGVSKRVAVAIGISL